MTTVSVILPTYNEAENIVPLVQDILDHLTGEDCEVLVVDDNSPDHTHAILAEAFKGDPRVRPLLRTEDPGLATAIRAGIEAAEGERIVVMDSDGTHDPEEIPRLLHVGGIYSIVSGSRFAPGGSMQDQSHYLASLFYNFLLRVILRTQVQDNLGGYFTIQARDLRKLDFDKIFYGYGEYFFRLLHEAQNQKFSIVELPAIYRARIHGQSKSNFLKLLFQYFTAAVKARMGKNYRPR